jgi:hypothetical protein
MKLSNNNLTELEKYPALTLKISKHIALILSLLATLRKGTWIHLNSKKFFALVAFLLFLVIVSLANSFLTFTPLAEADNSLLGYSNTMNITSTVPFSGTNSYYHFEAPNNNLIGWNINGGAAAVAATNSITGNYSVLFSSTVGDNTQCMTIDNNYPNYTMVVKAKIISDDDGESQNPMICFYLRYVDANNWLRAGLYYDTVHSVMRLKLDKYTNGGNYTVITDKQTPFSHSTTSTVYIFKFIDTGATVTAYVNNSLVINAQAYSSTVAVTQKGFGALGVSAQVMFDDFTVTVGNGGLTPVKVGYGYYTQNTLTLTPLASVTKPVVLDGKRYVFTGNGWGGFGTSAITAYSVDASWSSASAKVVATQYGNFQDFYVAAYPSVWRDLFVLYGASVPDGTHQQGFLVGFNTTTNAFQNLSYIPYLAAQYITGLTYSPDFNQFYLVTFIGSYFTNNQIIVTTPSTLFNQTAWTTVKYDSGNTNEIRITYFSSDKCVYFSYTDQTTGHGLVKRWNIAANTFKTVFNVPYTNSIPYLGNYIRSNSSTLFTSFANNTHWHFYYSNDGNTFTLFATLPVISPKGDGLETHGDIMPLPNNQVLIQSAGDGNPNSEMVLTTTSTGTAIEIYYNNAHINEIETFSDKSDSIILINGEGLSNHVGAYATILTSGLHYKCKADFSDINFGFGTTALAFNNINVVNSSYAEFSVNTAPIDGNTTFTLYYGKSSQTSLADKSVSPFPPLGTNQFLIF